MLAKVIRTRRDGLTGAAMFRTRIDYCCRKASAIALRNLAGDWRDAAFQMDASAGLNRGLYPVHAAIEQDRLPVSSGYLARAPL
ncbi:hypothetical protein JHW45_01200 [Paracoccus stylophorae]|uniref:Uncharacterized protein n=1 Tax=Paracoccus stylophorae TaxID=659350 RepID=A0ABY7SYP0_9RHOB|nr:hypothetical protein [Paracoccus stylophorae]WCR11062.1 hypothetical protein JHW45_01200 [Paracoccus stylophorae]